MIRTPQFQLMVLGIVCTIALALSEKILDFDLMLYQKWGLNRLHETVSKKRTAWLVLLRLVLSVFIIGVLIGLYILK
jgi:hypothetical protein